MYLTELYIVLHKIDLYDNFINQPDKEKNTNHY